MHRSLVIAKCCGKDLRELKQPHTLTEACQGLPTVPGLHSRSPTIPKLRRVAEAKARLLRQSQDQADPVLVGGGALHG